MSRDLRPSDIYTFSKSDAKECAEWNSLHLMDFRVPKDGEYFIGGSMGNGDKEIKSPGRPCVLVACFGWMPPGPRIILSLTKPGTERPCPV